MRKRRPNVDTGVLQRPLQAFYARLDALNPGDLESKVYPANVRLGWRDFLDDIQEYGADYIVVVMDRSRKGLLAYLVAFRDLTTGLLYVSDIARDPKLHGEQHADVMFALLTEASDLFAGEEFTAELRMPSRHLLDVFCNVLESEEMPEYFDDGASALFVRAVVRPKTELNQIREYVRARAKLRPNTSAVRSDPELWEHVKATVKAGNKGGKPGQWSARKAQLSVMLYKRAGGGYIGPRDPNNSLTRWTEQDWTTKSGRPSLETGERYLPRAAIEALSASEYAETTQRKRAGLRRGEQFTPQPAEIAAKVAPYRENDGDSMPYVPACPRATRDVALNLQNRQKCIDVAAYGPANPGMANIPFWQTKAKMWGITVAEAQTMRCGNCAAFNITAPMLACIRSGLGPEGDPEATANAGQLGFCQMFQFKCASLRTCNAWITGGPIK